MPILHTHLFYLILACSLFATSLQGAELPKSNLINETKRNHVPVLIPSYLRGTGFLLGAGYAGENLIGSTDLVALGIAGDAKGHSLTLMEVPLYGKFIQLQGEKHSLAVKPTVNYARTTNDDAKELRPNIDTTVQSLSLEVRPYADYLFLSVKSGEQTSSFNGFETTRNKRIDLPALHFTDLVQTRNELQAGLYIPLFKSDNKFQQNYIGGNIKHITLGDSPGLRGSKITSIQLDMQWLLAPGRFFYGQYFQSTAEATGKRSGDTPASIRSAMHIDCASSKTPDSCASTENALATFIAGHNAYGTAEPLGGLDRMKAYPSHYFRAAHVQYATIAVRFTRLLTMFGRDVFVHIFTESARTADTEKDLETAEILPSSGIDAGIRIHRKLSYQFILASGGDGNWISQLGIARTW